MTTNQARTRAQQAGRARGALTARSGEHAPSSGGRGAEPLAAPRYQAEGGGPGMAPRPSASTLADDWGADAIYGVYDGLGPDWDYDEAEEPWHARPSAGAYLLAAGFVLIAAVMVAPAVYRVLELAWEGRLW